MEPQAGATRPLLGLAAAVAVGAWLGQALPLPAAGPLLGLSALALLGALAGPSRLSVFALAAAALGIGASARSVEDEGYDRASLGRFMLLEAPETPVLLEGAATTDGRRAEDRLQIVLDVAAVEFRGSRLPLHGRARILVADASERLSVVQGEGLRIWATLRQPRGFASPGAFDVLADARRRGIHAHGFCKSPTLVERTHAPSGRGVATTLAAWRREARRVLQASLPPGDEEGLVRAMTLGDRAGVSPEAAEAFRIAGTYHLLAISGAQVALVAGLLVLLLQRTRLAPLWSAAVVCGAVWLYAAFVGGDPPVQRAAVMAALLALGKAFDLDADLVNLLGLAGGVLLVGSPTAVSDPSFQLSFVATLGILLLTPPLRRRLPGLPLGADVVLAASVAAQLSLLPLLAAHFHRLAPAAVLLNLVAAPLASGVLLAGFAILLAHGLLPPLERVCAETAYWLAHGLLRSGEVVRDWPLLDLRVGAPTPLSILVLALGLMLLLRERWGSGLPLTAAGVALLALGPGARADGRLRVTLLDVGQGDALVLQSPRGRFLVVDAGPASDRFDLGEAVVAPFLWSLGARRIDALALTHPDSDHTGGAGFVLRSFDVAEIWEGASNAHGTGAHRYLEAVSKSPARRVVLRKGGRLAWDDVEIEVLGPETRAGSAARTNDRSLVLAVRYRAVSLLLTGDVERRGEALLPPRRASVLKVAHHGSRTSTSEAFLESVRPRLALVSVGFRSPFGHPHAEVLARLQRQGASLFRTDRDGSLGAVTDGARLSLETQLSGAVDFR